MDYNNERKNYYKKGEMSQMNDFFRLLKNGNKTSLVAAIVNFVIALAKAFAFFFTGSTAMFAEMMHSLADAANQFFVYIGSAFSKKEPTDRFPNGFGRLVNLVCLGAVLVVGWMSIETIKHGIHQILHPEASQGMVLNIIVLGLGVALESFVLYKACGHILHDAHVEAKGAQVISQAIKHLSKAKPATKLVFMEDLVATGGGIVAILAILIGHFVGFYQSEGIASVLIGTSMLFVVGKVFLENAAGALGESDEEMKQILGAIVMQDPDIHDIQEMIVTKEGDDYHVDAKVEVDPDIPFAKVDDIQDRVQAKLLAQKGVTEVNLGFDEKDNIPHWENQNKEKETAKTGK